VSASWPLPDDGRPIHVLVVDDIGANLRLLDAVLTPRGFQVDTATSGAEALERIQALDVDIVLLDVNMPGMTGYEVCRRIRADERTRLLPVVMVTAAPEEERVRALEAGADDFLRQPLEQAELLARVRSLARLKRYHDTMAKQAAELSAWNHTLERRVDDQMSELERLRVLRRFLSPQIAEAMFESEDLSLLEPHRREVAVLAWELRGLATVSGMAGPEEELAVLEAFHETLGRLVGEHGATVGAFTGERLLAFFGDPAVDPDPTPRAVVLAEALRDAGLELTALHLRRGYQVTSSVGVDLGYATLGRIGFEGRLDYGAVGPVVSRAWQLCTLAGEGEVLLGQRAYDAVISTATVGEPRTVDSGGDRVTVVPLVSMVPGATPPTPPLLLRPAVPPAAAEADADGDAAPSTGGPAASPGDRAPAADLGGLELRVLGPLEVRLHGQPVAVTASKERALLALLVANHGRTLPVGQLAEDLWEGSPPESASAALRVHVSRLRRTLSAAGVEGILVTRPPGYSLEVPDDAVDITRFEALVADARAAAVAGDPGGAVQGFRAALALWRGPALAEVSASTFATAEAIRLEQGRLTALEDCLAAELDCGRHREVTAELEALVHEHVLRERLWELHLLALYRSGRQPDALRAFQELRRRLGEELGLDPSPALLELERAIVAHDPALRWTAASPAGA
jgi:DNA-binding response OmpR family regulator